MLFCEGLHGVCRGFVRGCVLGSWLFILWIVGQVYGWGSLFRLGNVSLASSDISWFALLGSLRVGGLAGLLWLCVRVRWRFDLGYRIEGPVAILSPGLHVTTCWLVLLTRSLKARCHGRYGAVRAL